MIETGSILSECNFDEVRYEKKAMRYEGTNAMPTDIIGIIHPNGIEYLIEVKATQVGYTELKEKDNEADCIIWLEFGDSFRGGKMNIQLAVVKNPSEIGVKSKQYNWQPFINEFNPEIRTYTSINEMWTVTH